MDYRHLGQSGLDAGLMRQIDEALGDVVVRDPTLTASPRVRP
jgi:hypothetical protein